MKNKTETPVSIKIPPIYNSFNKTTMTPEMINNIGIISEYLDPFSPDKYFCQAYFNPRELELSNSLNLFNADTLHNNKKYIGSINTPKCIRLKMSPISNEQTRVCLETK